MSSRFLKYQVLLIFMTMISVWVGGSLQAKAEVKGEVEIEAEAEAEVEVEVEAEAEVEVEVEAEAEAEVFGIPRDQATTISIQMIRETLNGYRDFELQQVPQAALVALMNYILDEIRPSQPERVLMEALGGEYWEDFDSWTDEKLGNYRYFVTVGRETYKGLYGAPSTFARTPQEYPFSDGLVGRTVAAFLEAWVHRENSFHEKSATQSWLAKKQRSWFLEFATDEAFLLTLIPVMTQNCSHCQDILDQNLRPVKIQSLIADSGASEKDLVRLVTEITSGGSINVDEIKIALATDHLKELPEKLSLSAKKRAIHLAQSLIWMVLPKSQTAKDVNYQAPSLVCGDLEESTVHEYVAAVDSQRAAAEESLRNLESDIERYQETQKLATAEGSIPDNAKDSTTGTTIGTTTSENGATAYRDLLLAKSRSLKEVLRLRRIAKSVASCLPQGNLGSLEHTAANEMNQQAAGWHNITSSTLTFLLMVLEQSDPSDLVIQRDGNIVFTPLDLLAWVESEQATRVADNQQGKDTVLDFYELYTRALHRVLRHPEFPLFLQAYDQPHSYSALPHTEILRQNLLRARLLTVAPADRGSQVDFALRNDNHLGTFLRSQKTDLDFWKLLTHFEQLKTHLQLMGRRFERRHIQSNVTGIAKAMENITHTTLAQELTPKQSQELFALWAPTLEANPQAVPWILKERLDQYRAADLNRESYYRFLGEFVLLKEFFPDAFPDEGKPLLSVVDRTVLTLQVILSHIYSDQSYSAQLGAPTNPLVASSNQVFDLFSDEFAAFQRNGSIIVSNTANRPPLFSRPGMYLCSRDCVIQAATAGNLESSSDSLERKFGRLDMHPLSLLMTGVVPETKIQVIYKNRDRNEIDSDYKIPIYRNASITLNFAEMGDVFILASGHTSAFWTEATPGAKGSDALLGDRQQAFGFVQATLSGAYLNQEPHGYLFDYQPLKGGCRQIGDTQQEVNCGAYPGESGADGKHGVRGGDLFIARYPQFLPHSYFVMIAAGSDGGDGGRGGNGGRQVHFIPENHDNNGMPHWSHPGAGGPGGRGGFNGRAGSIVLSGSFSHIEESRLDWTHPLIRFRGEVGKPGPTGKSNDGFAVEAPGKFNDPIETKKIYPPVPSPNAELADYTSVEGYTATVTNDKILQFSFEAK